MRKLLISGIALVLLSGIVCAGQDAQQSPMQPPDSMEQQSGQPKKAKAPTGALTGTVYCADTNSPARRAQIYLLQQNSFGQRSAAITDLDGQFAISSIREGEYYVVAVLPGYINLLSSLTKSHLDAMTEEERKKLLAEVPRVTISADQPAQASIRLERGAEIDGTVLYDDGSPAIGLQINLRLKSRERETGNTPAQMMSGRFSAEGLPNVTDDHGRFRILGITPGEYLVSVSVPTDSAEQDARDRIVAMMDTIAAMDVYVGGGLRPSKAETIKVDAGGASRDADITIPLSKLHTIRGQVVLKSTGRPAPSAFVQLLYADTKEPVRMAIAPNGEFEIHCVPEGNFLLRASAGREPLPEADFPDDDDGPGQESAFLFTVNPNPEEAQGGAEMPVAVTGDVDHLSIAAPDPPARNPGDVGGRDGQDASSAQQQIGPH